MKPCAHLRMKPYIFAGRHDFPLHLEAAASPSPALMVIREAVTRRSEVTSSAGAALRSAQRVQRSAGNFLILITVQYRRMPIVLPLRRGKVVSDSVSSHEKLVHVIIRSILILLLFVVVWTTVVHKKWKRGATTTR